MNQKAEKGTEYALKRKIFRMGGGYCVTIPLWLAEAKGIHEGDFVQLKFNSYGGLIIEKAEEAEEKH